MATAEKTRSSTSFKAWYSRNKNQLSKKRKHRYATDRQYQAKVKEASRLYRASKSDPSKYEGLVLITGLAKSINKSAQTIRIWEEKKYIPKAKRVGRSRFYTFSQCALVRDFSKFMDDNFSGRSKVFPKMRKAKTKEIYAEWSE